MSKYRAEVEAEEDVRQEALEAERRRGHYSKKNDTDFCSHGEETYRTALSNNCFKAKGDFRDLPNKTSSEHIASLAESRRARLGEAGDVEGHYTTAHAVTYWADGRGTVPAPDPQPSVPPPCPRPAPFASIA